MWLRDRASPTRKMRLSVHGAARTRRRRIAQTVTAVVNTAWTRRVTAVAVWMPIANAEMPSRIICVEAG